jgi:ribose 5-phosphate isomerase A
VNQDEQKQRVARAAIDEIQADLGADVVIGVGTGTTADQFIDLLGNLASPFKGAVASSERSAERLRKHGIRVLDLSEIEELPVYIDGADEITAELDMIKGGGGALTREKIVAAASRRFVCIADASKLVGQLGAFGVPIEVIPMAVRQVTKRLKSLEHTTGTPEPRLRLTREGRAYVTDNGNHIIDLHGLKVIEAKALEQALDGIAGVVCNGLFAKRGADVLLLASPTGIERYVRKA